MTRTVVDDRGTHSRISPSVCTAVFELILRHGDVASRIECPLQDDRVTAHVNTTLQQQQSTDLSSIDQVEVSVSLLDNDAMRALNHAYRNQDKATNVLSFESDMPVLHDEHAARLLVLGDLVFCPQVIDREAREQGKDIRQHWTHMIVHGTLHLCGYDHQTADEAVDMENLETRILAMLGLPDPYQQLARPAGKY